MNDVFKPSCIRLSEGDREALLHLFGESANDQQSIFCVDFKLITRHSSPDKHKIGPRKRQASAKVKREIVLKAKDLPCYFAQIFKVKVFISN